VSICFCTKSAICRIVGFSFPLPCVSLLSVSFRIPSFKGAKKAMRYIARHIVILLVIGYNIFQTPSTLQYRTKKVHFHKEAMAAFQKRVLCKNGEVKGGRHPKPADGADL